MKLCAVPGCNVRGGYKFPSDPEMCKKWRVAIRRAEEPGHGKKLWEPTENSIVCRNHFDPEDFRAPVQSACEMVGANSRTYLHPTAIPSRNIPGRPDETQVVVVRERKRHFDQRREQAEGQLTKDPPSEALMSPTVVHGPVALGCVEVNSEASQEIQNDQDMNMEEVQQKEITTKDQESQSGGGVPLITVQQFKDNPDFIKYYTGFEDYDHFVYVFSCLGPAAHELKYKSRYEL